MLWQYSGMCSVVSMHLGGKEPVPPKALNKIDYTTECKIVWTIKVNHLAWPFWQQWAGLLKPTTSLNTV